MQKQRESEQRNRPVVLQITNVMELGNLMKKLPEVKSMPTLVHFTSEQWNSAMEGVIPVKKGDLKNQPILEAVRMPGGNGEWIAGLSRCPPGCEPLIREMAVHPKEAPDRLGLTPHPDTFYYPECDCSQQPIDDHIEHKPKSSGDSVDESKDCRLVMRVYKTPLFPQGTVKFSCEGEDCKDCKIGIVGSAQRGRRVLLGCVCS
jgi:hypothetical protein